MLILLLNRGAFMQKRLFFILVLMLISLNYAYAKDLFNHNEEIKISNKNFSLILPKNTKETFVVKKKNNGIFIYDKVSKKAGFGGFAFGVKLYQNPSEHAMMPGGRKIGELTDKKGILYDMVLIQPTDVQYDYTKPIVNSYYNLYYAGNNDKYVIKGKSGSIYHKNQGMKGKDLYREILKKHITAINEKWDSTKLENENMSYMYNVLSKIDKNVLNKVGYIYDDINGDGIEELLIGEIAKDDWKGVVYDIYTMIDRKPVHVVSGGARNRYFICDDTFLCNEYSSGANENGWLVYILVENSTELFPQVGFKYDGYKNSKNPWFISYDFKNDKWENVSEKYFKERKSTFDKYKRFDYIPLKSYK